MCSAVCGVKHSVMNSKHSVLRIGSVPPTFVKRDCTQIDYLDLELSRDKCWEETIPPGDSAPRLRASYVDSDRISACFSTQVNQICPVTVRTMPDQLVQLPRDQLRQWVFNSPQRICAVSLVSRENKTVDGFKHRKNEQNVDEMGFEEENCIRHVAPVKADSKEETKSDGGVPSQNGTTEVHAVGAVTGATEVLSRNTSPDSYTSVNTCGQCHKEGDERLELKNTLDLSSLQLCAIESHGEVRKAHELINEVTPRTCPSAEDGQRGNIHTKQDITPPAWPSGIQTEPNTVPETPMELGKNMNPSEVANVESGTTELLPSRESYVSEENAHRHPQGISQEFQKDGAHRVFWPSAEPRSNIGQGEADDKTERFSCILQDSPATCLSCSSGQIQKLSESDQNEFEIDNLGSLGVDKSWDFPLGENNHLMSEKAIWLSPLVYPYGHFQAAKDGDMFTDPSSVPTSPPKCKKSEDTTMFTSCKPTDQSRGHKETYLRKEKTDSEDGDTYENEVDCIEESCLISPTLDKTLEKQTANFETKYASREVVLNHGIRKLIPRTAYLQRSFISQSNAGIENGRGSTDVHYTSKLEGEKVFELAEEKTADQLHKSLDCKSGAAVERCSDVVRQDPAAVDRCVIDQAKQAANTEMLKAPDDTWIWDCLHLSRIATQQILNLQEDEKISLSNT
ncbi:hypothetical protein EGW08_008486 [Elysia chlorotica]|uniref:Uncharacterized protein n=1 Tax=Elysia chlorotica TaxID=188477 RepID=A0A3S1BAI1_ELYCH|nr:hypothetical protein EGW08_008486 [Elysia chlorotica]